MHLTAEPIHLVKEHFWQSQDISLELRPFASQLVDGTAKHLEAIDAEIRTTSKNWKLHRMPIVDLTILRIATYEILYINEIDAAISINEAVEIAKSYSTLEFTKVY